MSQLVEVNDITQRIYTVRGVKVMLDRDLADLYGVETKRLKEQVRRNIDRFPKDFMFELSNLEFRNLRSQIATSSWGGPRYVPMAFTEQGVAMLSSVLHSKKAIQINVQIMRAFVQLRHLVLDHAELKREVAALRSQTEERFEVVFTVLDKLMSDDNESKNKIGFVKKD
ncbi:DNA-binding protein [Desulfosarcina widdelii]|uniref:DNA-binding protein n=1 Tax=Desulfosarcina widdelii TaxID=947919 RepID=A0A5K7Z8U3_9BACT|nr:ORF6N domain-containing protein [Desulfosarcina widdelii]BBO77478.1 DNA-binding protein [Desulfosarcina widdelii]